MALINSTKLIVSATGTAVSDSIKLRGDFSISITGTFSGSIDLRRTVEGNTGVVKTYTDVTEEKGFEAMSGCEYFVSYSISSGTANIVLGDQKV